MQHKYAPAPEEYLTNTQQSKTFTNQEMQILTALTKDTLSITHCDTGGCASKGETEQRRCSIKLSRKIPGSDDFCSVSLLASNFGS